MTGPLCLVVLAFATLSHSVPQDDAADAPSQEAVEENQYALSWPRTYTVDGHHVVVFQPQIDRWDEYKEVSARAAVAVTLDGAEQTEYGAVRMTASTRVDHETRSVLLGAREIAGVNFPDTEAETFMQVREVIEDALPNEQEMIMSLDEIIAYLAIDTQPVREEEVNLDPPPIHYSDESAILVIFIGKPRFEMIADTDLLFAVNTNWDVILDPTTSTYYVLDGEGWLQSKDPLNGPWTVATALPATFASIPTGEPNWEEVVKRIPGTPSSAAPDVIVSNEPAELIITDGPPEFSPIEGTTVLYVANTDSDLFLCDGEHYVLTAGRWFRAKDLEGPWSAATSDLPEEFAKIPADHEVGYVLASVPGTPEAQAAVILASVPRAATVKKSEATVTVAYDGEPKFVEIEGARGVSYAVNTPYDVFMTGGAYYCCYQGVWFVARDAAGPWRVADAVPPDLYSIPPTNPKHNVTYVTVVESTPDTVVVEQSSGYAGQYIAAGVLLFGLGYAIAEAVDDDDYSHYHYSAHYYSYGCAARYDYYGGGFYSGARAYGPYGVAGRAAAYNPATGGWARGAYAYGPNRSAYAREGYNPHTDRYGAQIGGSNPYGSWGRTVVEEDGEWARAGHRSTDEGTVFAGETSEGGAIVGGRTDNRSGFVAQSEEGDVYVGKDGEVYKRNENGQWKQREDGDWQNVDEGDIERPNREGGRNQPSSQNAPERRQELEREFESRERGTERARTFSGGGRSGGARSGGGGRRR